MTTFRFGSGEDPGTQPAAVTRLPRRYAEIWWPRGLGFPTPLAAMYRTNPEQLAGEFGPPRSSRQSRIHCLNRPVGTNFRCVHDDAHPELSYPAQRHPRSRWRRVRRRWLGAGQPHRPNYFGASRDEVCNPLAVTAVLTPGIVRRGWAANWSVVVDLDSGRVEHIPLRAEGVFALARSGSRAVIVVVVVQRVAVVVELRRSIGSGAGGQ